MDAAGFIFCRQDDCEIKGIQKRNIKEKYKIGIQKRNTKEKRKR